MLHRCVTCLKDLPPEAFGVQRLKYDGRPGRKPRQNVRNSRCLSCDSRANRKRNDMATGRELMAADDAAKRRLAAADNDAPPTGYILIDGQEVPVWLPPGRTPASLRLRTFRKTRVLHDTSSIVASAAAPVHRKSGTS